MMFDVASDFLGAQSRHNDIRLLATLYPALLLVRFTLSKRDQARYQAALPCPCAPPRPRFLACLAVPRVSARTFAALAWGFQLSLLLAVLGWWPRVALVGAALLYFFYFGQITNLGYVIRKTNTVPVFLLLLGLAPGVTAAWEAPAPRWPVTLLCALVVAMYTASGIAKLRHAGLGWARGGATLRMVLWEHQLLVDVPLAGWVAARPRLCAAVSWATLVWELTFPVVLVSPRLAPMWVGAAVCFHVGTLVTMRIDYLKYAGLALPTFFVAPLGELVRTLGAGLREVWT